MSSSFLVKFVSTLLYLLNLGHKLHDQFDYLHGITSEGHQYQHLGTHKALVTHVPKRMSVPRFIVMKQASKEKK